MRSCFDLGDTDVAGFVAGDVSGGGLFGCDDGDGDDGGAVVFDARRVHALRGGNGVFSVVL